MCNFIITLKSNNSSRMIHINLFQSQNIEPVHALQTKCLGRTSIWLFNIHQYIIVMSNYILSSSAFQLWRFNKHLVVPLLIT